MAKKTSLADSIRAALPRNRPGGAPWHERIDPAVLAELKTLRAEWQSGAIDIGGRTLGRAIARRLNDENLSTVGEQGVLSWLKRKD